MTLRIRVVRAAVVELGNARANYRLGEELETAIRETLARVAASPESFPRVDAAPGIRWALVPRFLFKIYFEVQGEAIRVLAFAHPRRRPGYWKRRATPG